MTEGHADAVLCASIFHYGQYTVGEAKRAMAGGHRRPSVAPPTAVFVDVDRPP